MFLYQSHNKIRYKTLFATYILYDERKTLLNCSVFPAFYVYSAMSCINVEYGELEKVGNT